MTEHGLRYLFGAAQRRGVMEHTVAAYLKYLNIPVSQKYCEKLILSHPDYPSFLSIADTLERLGIRYKVAKVGKEHLDHLTFPYLLQSNVKRGELTFIKNRKGLEGHKLDFEDSNGVVLQAEPVDTIADEENNKQRSKEIFLRVVSVALISAVVILLSLSAIQSISWVYISLLITALGGAIVSYLIVAKELGFQYKPVESFCRAGKKTSCDAILDSDAATLFGPVTFSDAAISCFLFQFMTVGFLIPQFEEALPTLWVLTGLSALTIPVIGYSLYYQAIRVKTWCRLCLMVDGVLILQLALFGYMYITGVVSVMDVNIFPLVLAVLLFVVIGSSVLLIKHILKRSSLSEQAEIAANRIKNAPDVFMHLLAQEMRVDVTPFEQELLIGDPKAPVKIIMAASLWCSPCKAGFEQATELVAAYPGKVNLVIRLLESSEDNSNHPGVSTYILTYWQQQIQGKSEASVRTEKLIRDWYVTRELEAFTQQYPIDKVTDMTGISRLADQHNEWMNQSEITTTPTFFINGYQLPKQYRLEDVMALIPAVADHFAQDTILQDELAINK